MYANASTLEKPITDCPDGVTTLGSGSASGALVNVLYVPRELSQVALRFLYSKGKLLDEMLAGAGQQAAAEDSTTMLLRSVKEVGQGTVSGQTSLQAKVLDAFRKLQQTQYDELQAAIGTLTPGRRLQESDAPGSETQAPQRAQRHSMTLDDRLRQHSGA
eukprot:585472-Heterocapsa_arctica.AAC.1